MKISCKNCIWWVRAKPYAWGDCTYPLPVWAFDIIDSPTGMIAPGHEEEQAANCDLFTLPEALPSHAANLAYQIHLAYEKPGTTAVDIINIIRESCLRPGPRPEKPSCLNPK